MNYEEVKAEVTRLIHAQWGSKESAEKLAQRILEFLDSIGYDNSRTYKD